MDETHFLSQNHLRRYGTLRFIAFLNLINVKTYQFEHSVKDDQIILKNCKYQFS
jgi:hypothetical protein